MSGGTGPGGIDEDAARAINTGRETIGVMLRTAQKRLQKVFIAFTIGMLGGIMLMRSVIWPQLKADLLAKGASVIAQTPFDVILLQVKIGLGLGVIFALPVLFYYGKGPLAERDIVPDVEVSTWKLIAVAGFSVALFLVGTLYAYLLFFPIMFSFLAGNALGAGLAPLYSIVHWTQFIFVLALSFGLAAQLPLAMTALSYAEIVPYETFRDKWKYAVVLIFTFGAVFSPPDPFTQIMWALPLLGLYGFSLYLSKLVVTARRGSEHLDLGAALRGRWNVLAGAAVLGFAVVYGVLSAGGVALVNPTLSQYGLGLSPVESVVGLPRESAILVVAGVVGVVVAIAAALYVVYEAAEAATRRAAAAESGAGQPGDGAAAAAAGSPGNPAAIDLENLDAGGVYAAPPEAFASLTEEDALAHARAAMDAEQPDKAEAILDRFDEAAARQEMEDGTSTAGADTAAAEAGDAGADDVESEESGALTRTTAGVVDAFTEEDTTEEDIGGYYYDIAFILDSLRSRAFRLVAVFMLVLAGTFAFLYQGGIGTIRADFVSRIPAAVRPDPAQTAWPITLHPVEALVFEVKLSTVLAAIAILPFVLYYAWPALEERGIVTGDKRVLGVWGGSIAITLVVGSALGYMFVAPEIISFLVADALRAGMTISYRVNNFFWMVFLTTAGIGLLVEVPVTMVLFHVGGLVSYHSMRRRWRVVVIAAFVFGALVTPDSLYTMLLIGIPVALAYFVGLAILWVVTLGGRRGKTPPSTAERTA